MIKKDLADMRKYMKLESTMFKIGQLYSIYLKKDNSEIIHKDIVHFDSLDSDTQELYLKNFKKILSGAIDTKLFELSFENIEKENCTQSILYTAMEDKGGNDYLNSLDEIVNKMAANYNYETDVVITFARGEYWKGAKKRRKEADEAIDDIVFSLDFMLCSVNKIEPSKKTLQFDFINKTFKASSVLDANVNLNSPLDGFMFPCFNNNSADVNHIMYYSGMSNGVNMDFVNGALDCSLKITAEEEKNCFNAILKNVVGEAIKPETMQTIFEKIAEKSVEVEEGEESTVTMKDMQSILQNSGVEVKDIESLEKVYEETLGTLKFDFKVDNIIPDLKSKSVKIESETADIRIAPGSLNKIRQVVDKNGNRCLLIELDENIQINGFDLETEKLE